MLPRVKWLLGEWRGYGGGDEVEKGAVDYAMEQEVIDLLNGYSTRTRDKCMPQRESTA